MDTAALNYDLPEELIAQGPAEPRDASRLLVFDRATGQIEEAVFHDIGRWLRPKDCLTLNDTRVIRARLRGTKETGGKVELFLLREIGPGEWEALVRPSAKVKPGSAIRIGESARAMVGEVLPEGHRLITFDSLDVLSVLEQQGEVPLPPYITRESADARDTVRYQTIFAQTPGAVAAPTAGLHFTDAIFQGLDAGGVNRAFLTLHVGYGTFKPIQAERLEDHRVDPEEFILSDETANLLNRTRAEGGRIVAVGTTSTRVLESQFRDGQFQPGEGKTGHYIYPPYTFRGVNALVTNFHLPRSSLLALVCAFAGTEPVLAAYRYAVEKRFRFYSYGDAMLIV